MTEHVGTRIIEYNKVDAGLAELRGRLANVVYDVKTPEGMAAARRDRRECVSLRTDLEALRKTLKADVLERGRLIDDEARKIREPIEALEKPIDAQIKMEEERVAAERAAREQKERDRVNSIHHRIAAISEMPAQMVGRSSLAIKKQSEDVLSDKLEWAEEFIDIARAASSRTVTVLNEMLAAALNREEEAAIEKARKEREKREEAERQEAAKKFIAEENARLQAQRREQEAERERLEAAERDAQARRDEADRAALLRREAADFEAEKKRAAAQKEQDERDAVLRQERERQEEERREIERQKIELLDGAEMLQRFVTRFGKRREFASVVRAIKDYLDKALA